MKKKIVSKKGIKVTLEDLAVMVKNGFDTVDARFEQVDRRFEGMETKENADRRFKLIVDEFQRLNTEVKEIKGNFSPFMRVITEQEKEISRIEERVHRVEVKVGIQNNV